MLLRNCKICGFEGPYDRDGVTARLRGFHGYVCWDCVLEEQRTWRGTDLGREQSREITAAYRLRKALKARTVG